MVRFKRLVTGSLFVALVFLAMVVAAVFGNDGSFLFAATAHAQTPREAGVPGSLEQSVVGTIVLSIGQEQTLVIGVRGINDASGAPARAKDLEPTADWYVGHPGVRYTSSGAAIKLQADRKGIGYVLGRRQGTFIRDGQETRGSVIATWILVVPEEPPLPIQSFPDIACAVISGRVVMRGTSQGVAGASIELIGVRSGLKRGDWRSGADGRFTLTAVNLLSVDQYEIMVQKNMPPTAGTGGARDKPDELFLENLWPIYEYTFRLNQDNCLNLNLGNIEMASVRDQEQASGRMDRQVKFITPQSGSDQAPAGASWQMGQAPGSRSAPAWVLSPDPDLRVFIAAEEDEMVNQEPAGRSSPARRAQVSYKGFVEVDFHLKATLSLTFEGSNVTGELYAPRVMGQNVRLPGARMHLSGTLAGKWEDTGTIAGESAGQILWAGLQPEDRQGSFTINREGNQIRFQSTGFYYNRYIFEALGFKYAASDDHASAVDDETGTTVENSVVILIDASGSMQGAKIANAKATARQQIGLLGPETELAVIAFSGNAVKTSFIPMKPAGRSCAMAVVDSIQARGGTPLAQSIREAGAYMRRNARGKNLTLIVLSDGEETAGGDPPAEVQRLNDMTVAW